MTNNLQHPDITAADATGYGYHVDTRAPHCPVCGAECETVYRERRNGEALGCENCVMVCDAWNDEGALNE